MYMQALYSVLIDDKGIHNIYCYYSFDVVHLQDNYQQQSRNKQHFQEFAIKINALLLVPIS